MAVDTAPLQPTTIQKLATAVYPSFAMLAGMHNSMSLLPSRMVR
jgi:hypothetical protein